MRTEEERIKNLRKWNQTIERQKTMASPQSSECSSIRIELPDWDILKLALEAHIENITLNQYIINIITEQLDETRGGSPKKPDTDN